MAANSTRFCSDGTFGPTSCTRNFDFTLTFEQSILSILPSALLLLLTPARLIQLSGRNPKTFPKDRNYAFKTIAATINFGVQLALVVLWNSSSTVRIPTSIPSAALSLADAAMILCLSYAEDRKSTKPSTLLNVYLVFSILFEATAVRSLWLTYRSSVAAVQSASVGIKILMLYLEAQSKTSYLKPPYNGYPPEATSGILNLSFVWWLNRLFVTGFRKLITSQELFDIDLDLGAESLSRRLQLVWGRCSEPEKPLALPKAAAYCFRWNLLAVVFPRLCFIGFSFAQPFLITSAIQYLEDPDTTENRSHGYGLIGAAFLIYFGLAISRVHYTQRFSRVVTMFRGAMISLIYNRTLSLQDGAFNDGAAVTLMSTDTDNIIEFLEKINDIWASSVQIAIGIWLLERQIGATCVVPLILSLVCAVGQGAVAKNIGQDQQNWNQAIQNRVKTSSSILGSMKALKISGMENVLSQNLQEQRENELKVSRPFFWGILWLNGLANAPMIWSPVISFIVFAVQAKIRGQSSLTTVQAFTSLSIISLVTSPASKLLAVLPQIAASLGCFERIQKYLVSPSTEDTRQSLTSPSTFNLSDAQISDHTTESGNFELSQISRTSSPPLIAVEIKNATIFPATTAKTAAICDVSFTVESGSLTVLLGPVGSGKTVLVKAILGELPCITGSIAVSSKRMSYCSQTSWLLNTSIRNNIIGPLDEKWDEEWYNSVVHACDLEEDFRRWPEGDRTMIGSKGLMLSGGQKQRVALARAVYARADIVLLDDVLSALDIKTQQVINTRLLSMTGLLRQLGSTVIMITHSNRFLDLADKIIVLNSKGKLATQGTHSELIRNEDFSTLVRAQTGTATDDQLPAPGSESDQPQKKEGSASPESDKLMDLTRRNGDITVYKYYFRTIGLPLLVSYLVVQTVSAFMENFPQVWLSWWTQSGGEQLPLYLSVYATLALAASLTLLVCIWMVFLNVMPRSAITLHKKLLDTVMNAPLSFFASTDTGVTLNRFSQDMSLVDLALPIAMSSTASAFFESIAQAALISTGSSYMALTIPFTACAIFGIQDVYLKTSRQLRFLDLENKSPLYSHFLETLEGVTTIRAFGWEHAAEQTQSRNLDDSQKPYYMLLCVQRWLNLVLDLMVTALAVIVVTLAVQLRSTTSAGLLGIALNNMLNFNQSLSNLVTSWTSLETSLGAIARVKTFAESTPSEKLPSSEDFLPPSAWPTSGHIQIKDVSATYGNSLLALDRISMEIAPGQKIGICGRTGSGKSSLILALLRLIDISEGNIIIDGIDISRIPRDLIRERLIAIPQDAFILSGSLRANADPRGLATDAEIVSALTKVGIWHTLEQRGGLDVALEEQPLSQGQQQLFCLVRAMLRKSKILVLDEATSSVDSETDRVMQEVLREEFRGYTVINVAHRLETIMDSDKIAVFGAAGKLVEFEKPEALLARDSLFRQIYRL